MYQRTTVTYWPCALYIIVSHYGFNINFIRLYRGFHSLRTHLWVYVAEVLSLTILGPRFLSLASRFVLCLCSVYARCSMCSLALFLGKFLWNPIHKTQYANKKMPFFSLLHGLHSILSSFFIFSFISYQQLDFQRWYVLIFMILVWDFVKYMAFFASNLLCMYFSRYFNMMLRLLEIYHMTWSFGWYDDFERLWMIKIALTFWPDGIWHHCFDFENS